MPLVCQSCLLNNHPDAEPDDQTDGPIACDECGVQEVCYSVTDERTSRRRKRQKPDRDEEGDDDDQEDELDLTPVRPFPVHASHSANGHAPASIRSDYWLYLEKPRKGSDPVTQFAGRPSPGDLERIQKGALRVFYCRGGRFVEVSADGGERVVTVVGEPQPQPRRITEQDGMELIEQTVAAIEAADSLDGQHPIVRPRLRVDLAELALNGVDLSAVSDADDGELAEDE